MKSLANEHEALNKSWRLPYEKLPLLNVGDISPQNLTLFKQSAEQLILSAFQEGVEVQKLLRAQSRVVDQILYHLWTTLISASIPAWSLVAVGGYGRSELHPCSDIDLMILLDKDPNLEQTEIISQFITLIWDSGIELGHSVRTLTQCVVEAKADISVATNLMESRLIAGSPLLFDDMTYRTNSSQIWSGKSFYHAKLLEQKNRHKRFLSSSYSLQPNLKSSPGGLRDIQVIGWVIKRHFQVDSLSALVALGFINQSEFKSLMSCLHFLWKVRFALHVITGRREDRLLFEHQGAVATMLGFKSENENSAVEQLMRRYYRTVLRIRELNDVLLQLFNEAIENNEPQTPLTIINQDFAISGEFIEARHPLVFQNDPANIFRLFIHLADNPSLKKIRAQTVRILQNSLPLINNEFRKNEENQQNFLSILSQHQSLSTAFVYMKRYGVLKRYLPVYSKIVGLMQFDLFHTYTVDEHTLFLLKNIARFSQEKHAEEFPLCSKIVSRLERPEILYITGLFHDIAKGRGGDHCELGAIEAKKFCLDHQLQIEDAELISWLVKNHLLLSLFSQKKDIYDPEVIAQFAAQVQDARRLDLLYVLTVADVRATNPSLWNSWREALTRELYTQTSIWLSSPDKRLKDRSQFAKLNKLEAKALLEGRGINPNILNYLQSETDDSYFQKYSASQVAWHCKILDGFYNDNQPKVQTIQVRRHPNEGGSEVFVYCKDRKGLFSELCQLLFQQQLNIMKSTIHTNPDGYCLNTFVVLELDGNPISSSRRNQIIAKNLNENLGSEPKVIHKLRKPKHFSHFKLETRINLNPSHQPNVYELELITLDRPGLLAQVGQIFNRLDIRLQSAKIATFGEKVEDLFLVNLPKNISFNDNLSIEKLKLEIIALLGDAS